MNRSKPSLQIVRLEWGKVELEDGSVFRDVKIYPGGAREWDWNETGTTHHNGVQLSDVEELLKNGADTVVLTQGVLGRLAIPQGLVNHLTTRGIKVYMGRTKKAVKRYNRLCEDSKVGILIHSTC